jgi:hypothetical protein
MLDTATRIARLAGIVAILGAHLGSVTAARAAGAVTGGPPLALRLEPHGFPVAELVPAIDAWRRACGVDFGTRLPALVLEGPGVPVTLRRWPDSSSRHGRCGQTRLFIQDGQVIAASIEIFARQMDGTHCFPLVEELAHEIGHLLGLADDPTGPRGSIMGPRRPGQHRVVTPRDCSAAGARGGMVRVLFDAEDEEIFARHQAAAVIAAAAEPVASASPREGVASRRARAVAVEDADIVARRVHPGAVGMPGWTQEGILVSQLLPPLTW